MKFGRLFVSSGTLFYCVRSPPFLFPRHPLESRTLFYSSSFSCDREARGGKEVEEIKKERRRPFVSQSIDKSAPVRCNRTESVLQGRGGGEMATEEGEEGKKSNLAKWTRSDLPLPLLFPSLPPPAIPPSPQELQPGGGRSREGICYSP